jgi:hypothetical protein
MATVPTPLTGLEEGAFELGAESTANFPSSMEMLERAGVAGLEGVETGFPTDISSLVPLAENIYRDLGDITAERYAGTGVLMSGGTTGFGAQRAREAKDIAVELGALQGRYDESAAERRSRLLLGETVPRLAEAQLALPLRYGQDLFSLGERYRVAQEGIRGRPYQALQALSGMQPAVLTQAGYNPSQYGGLSA